MKTCQKCGTTYDDAMSFCSRDGEVLGDDHAAMVGRILDGQYEIEAFIAEGGMGAVYRARHTLLGDRVAIKILPPEMRRNQEWLKRFQREGQAARRFRHPNSVIVHDLRTSVAEGFDYLVMEYVEGRTLEEEARVRGGRLAPAESLKVIEMVASVLDAAHAQGVIHRDLKPSNIMLTDDGAVKVLDLGIAKISDSKFGETALTTAGQLLGTPYYMSPEQWGEIPRDGGLEIDGRADLYSLGVVVYQITTGDLPFKATTAIELRRAHCHEKPRPLESFDASIPAAWSRAVLCAMAKDRSERQASAGEFARELREALGVASEPKMISRADAPTMAGTFNETDPATRGETAQQRPAAVTVVDNLPPEDMASGAAVANAGVLPLGAAAASAQPKRSWTLGLMSSRGCQVSLTVAAMVVLAVMVGGYAMLSKLGSGSDRLSNAPTGAGANNTNAPPVPASATNANRNTNETANSNAPGATGKEFLRYHLLLSSSAFSSDVKRAAGNEPVSTGQSLQFSFTASEDGFLYMLGEDAGGNQVVMPLGTLVAVAKVEAGEETVLPALAHIKLNSEPGTENFTVIFSETPLDLPFAAETLPIDGSFRKLTKDEQRQIRELRHKAASASTGFPGGDEVGALIHLKGVRAGRPVVFDIKLQLKRP